MTIAYAKGFTIVELLVTIIVLVILVGLAIFAPRNLQKYSNASEQEEDVANIIRRLEVAYSSQDIGSPSYPSTVELLNDINGRTRTMARTNPNIFIAPRASSSSVIAATNATTLGPAGPETPTTAQYVYQPLRADGALCTADPSAPSPASRCVRFIIYYRDVFDNTVQQRKSMRQQ